MRRKLRPLRRLCGNWKRKWLRFELKMNALRQHLALLDAQMLAQYSKQHMVWDACLADPQTIDSAVNWGRRQPSDEAGAGYVRSVLSLFSEGQGANSYPWPLYVQVRATPDSRATISSANAFAVNARLINRGAGFGAAMFSDVQHSGTGTDVGFDFELIRSNDAGRVIGLNILNAGDPANLQGTEHSGDEAINIQTKVRDEGWLTAIHLERNAASGNAGKRGIWIEGKYEIGLDMEDNNISSTAAPRYSLMKTRPSFSG